MRGARGGGGRLTYILTYLTSKLMDNDSVRKCCHYLGGEGGGETA